MAPRAERTLDHVIQNDSSNSKISFRLEVTVILQKKLKKISSSSPSSSSHLHLMISNLGHALSLGISIVVANKTYKTVVFTSLTV